LSIEATVIRPFSMRFEEYPFNTPFFSRERQQ
jgi:hypothetical protein